MSETNEGTNIPGEAQPSVEDRARDMGWVPQDEWKGNADQWRPAEEFVRRGEEILPIVKSRLEKSEDQVNTLTRKIDDLTQDYNDRFERMQRTSQLALERQAQQIKAHYETKKREAVELADPAAYEQAAKEEALALEEHTKAVEAEQEPKGDQNGSAIPSGIRLKVDAWVEENPWFLSDPALSGYARGVDEEIRREKPGMAIEDHLEEVKSRVSAAFPEKFGKSAPQPSQVEGGGALPSGSGAGKGAADLPEDARKQGMEFVSQGLFKNLDEYATEYWSE